MPEGRALGRRPHLKEGLKPGPRDLIVEGLTGLEAGLRALFRSTTLNDPPASRPELGSGVEGLGWFGGRRRPDGLLRRAEAAGGGPP
ncbi:MAG: hypothetical protein ACREPI_02240 [Candidatus Dormibacterales bacterium]